MSCQTWNLFLKINMIYIDFQDYDGLKIEE